jgi:hypothetical protein
VLAPVHLAALTSIPAPPIALAAFRVPFACVARGGQRRERSSSGPERGPGIGPA